MRWNENFNVTSKPKKKYERRQKKSRDHGFREFLWVELGNCTLKTEREAVQELLLKGGTA